MSGLERGGADHYARQKQYEYRATSNLVLTAENRSRELGPSGEVETLAGRINIRQMGDKAQRERPKELEERLQKSRDRKKKKTEIEGRRKKELEQAEFLGAIDTSESFYKPKTKLTKVAYEQLLSFVQNRMGDVPRDILRGAGDEVLATLKNDRKTDPERKRDIEALLGDMSTDEFSRVVSVGKSITDYREEEEEEEEEAGTLNDEIGVSVVIDDDDEEEESEVDEVADVEEEEEEGLQDTAEDMRLSAIDPEKAAAEDFGASRDEEMSEDEESSISKRKALELDPREVDGYWIQRMLAKMPRYENQPEQCREAANEVLKIMETSDDDRDCENSLVGLLGYDQFDLIKLLMHNRATIVYCTKLGQASAEVKKMIEQEMAADPVLAPILERIKKTGSTAGERTKALDSRLRREAKQLAKMGKMQVETDEKDIDATISTSAPSKLDLNLAKRKALDLEGLAFAQGGHLMSNRKIKLPEGVKRTPKKGYEEVHVPAMKPKPFSSGEKLVPISSLPEWAQAAFPNMKSLNRVQSRLYSAAFEDADNLLVCAPTGAGKTNVAVLTMLHEIGLHRMKHSDKASKETNLDAFKIIYIAPMKALVQEIVGSFQKRLSPYGISVKELSGDMQLTKQQINETQVIVSTPEKWDVVTRKSGDRTYTQLVRLIIIDEIHLLHDERGPVLESIVARTLRQVEQTQEMVRLVGLSATLPNYEDVARFLRVKPDKGLFFFDASYRPVPLQQQYIGISERKALKRFQLMNEICYEKVVDQAGRNQVLVFVHSRKETAKTAKAIRDMALEKDTLSKFLSDDSASREILQVEGEHVKNSELKDLLPYGFAIHHAGLTRGDRTLVEDLFADGHIQICVCTATLAWGVNLPAHTVVIKGTQVYNPEKGSWSELSHMDLMQMLGRAGRPAFDTTGEGIVITSHNELQYYLSLMNAQLPVESQLIAQLPDHLNAECVLGNITNVQEGVHWLGYTYLYVRMMKNPSLYGVDGEELQADPTLEQRRLDLIHSAAIILDKNGLVKYDRRSGALAVTDMGRVASHYYISAYSMSVYNEHLKPTMSDIELFRLFCMSREFRQIIVRDEEKLELQKMLDRVPIPVKETIEEPTAKINVLLQSYISQLKLEGFALLADMVYVTQSAGRIVRALYEIVVRRGWAQLAERCLTLARMVDRRMWSSQTPLRQFKQCPEDVLKKLERKDIPFERLYDLTPQEVGELVRAPKLGKSLHKLIHMMPRLELAAHVQPVTRSCLKVELTITPDFLYEEKVHGPAQLFWILVEDGDGQNILHAERFLLRHRFAAEEHSIQFTVPLFEPLPPQYFIRCVSDRWLGSETVLPISFRHLILPEKYPPHTELLDLQPLPVSVLHNTAYETLFARREKGPSVQHFNPIQTQCYSTLYNTDDNVLIGAPCGSGKTICAEFAILRAFNNNVNARIVYVVPMPGIVDERFREWKEKFGAIGKKVGKFTGEMATDVKTLETNHICIGTPTDWDMLSRRWKQRKSVATISLFIADELHMIGSAGGPPFEVVVSRMRYIASNTGNSIRLVGLSTSLANAKDVADWMGVPSHAVFNFHPNVRPVPLEIHIQGFDVQGLHPMLLAMVRPTFLALKHNIGGAAQGLVFAPTKRQVKTLVFELLCHCPPPKDGSAMEEDETEGDTTRFLACSLEQIEPFVKAAKDKVLKQSLPFGIGVYHDGLIDADRKLVEELYQTGAIRVIVASQDMAWGMPMRATVVVIAGLMVADTHRHTTADVPIPQVLQMMGMATDPTSGSLGKCFIYCHIHKKDFYKKFVFEPLPLESHLDHFLHDTMNSEIVSKTITSKQDAVDYLTWTFLYRRLPRNPNYYNLTGTTHRHLSDALSEMVETTIEDLENSRCISIDNDMDVAPLNLGMIASYYYVRYTTIELYGSSIQETTKDMLKFVSARGLLEILSSASEFDDQEIPVREKEERLLEQLHKHVRFSVPNAKFTTASTKTNLLLQAYFSRMKVPVEMKDDQRRIVSNAHRLLQAMVDVISSNGWLVPALAAMEIAQMTTQGLWDDDSPLMQLPHLSKETAERFKREGIETVFDLLEMDDNKREELLALKTPAQLAEVAAACNSFPSIEVSYQIEDEDEISAGDSVTVAVTLERDEEVEDEAELLDTKAVAPMFPGEKEVGWWLVVGDTSKGTLLCIKRIGSVRKKRFATKLEFIAPELVGKHDLTLYLMCDAYIGADQEFEFVIDVKEAEEEEESGEE